MGKYEVTHDLAALDTLVERLRFNYDLLEYEDGAIVADLATRLKMAGADAEHDCFKALEHIAYDLQGALRARELYFPERKRSTVDPSTKKNKYLSRPKRFWKPNRFSIAQINAERWSFHRLGMKTVREVIETLNTDDFPKKAKLHYVDLTELNIDRADFREFVSGLPNIKTLILNQKHKLLLKDELSDLKALHPNLEVVHRDLYPEIVVPKVVAPMVIAPVLKLADQFAALELKALTGQSAGVLQGVSLDTTVGELKNLIAKRVGFMPRYLILNGKKMDETKTLAACGVVHLGFSTITFVNTFRLI